MSKFGKLRKLSTEEIKRLYGHEQRDLSPWIDENIDILNDVLNLRINIDELEASAENFRIDMLGTEGYSNMPVVIENQFGKSDHDHLGKLITYSAHKEAGINIWIANKIQLAHRNAIEWLNKNTPEEMIFYGLELEIIQIDDSNPAPNFLIVAGPPPEKRVKSATPEGEISPRNKRYLKFFEKFRDRLLETTKLFRKKNVWPANNWTLSFGKSGFFFGVSFSKTNQFRIELYIDTGNKKDTKDAFDQLYEIKDRIEADLGYTLIWNKIPEKRACRIYLDREGTIDDDEEKLEEYIDYAIPIVIKFHEVFVPIIKKIEFSK